ncbi:fibronectin-like [Denticeps clupeoides]|uniref:fibronectin-like n=1 Tax=Denticeps clupeoides TaxID=299321 RepID=UPI0010A2AD66|nr:fibronectin-like [Denticeps clupeoides]XP_028851372.1 fibronectin-like [Denticeps clupeoides]XP_028851383.1 fibronectin-like [Denticeps clupeoides]XP_028851393.1 fibronectin-like [Denticeps clupeoides]
MSDLGDYHYGATAPENLHARCQKGTKRKNEDDPYPTSTLHQQPYSEAKRDDSETKSTSVSVSGPPETGGPEGPGDRSIQHERPESPVSSALSMKSDRSMAEPMSFRGDSAISTKVQMQRPDSPSSTSVWSEHSEWSEPIILHPENKSCTDHVHICALCAVMKHSSHEVACSKPENQNICFGATKQPSKKDLPPPGPIQFTSVTSDSVSLCWGTPEGPTGPQRFRVNWKQEGTQQSLIVPVTTITIESLSPGEQYEFSVATIGDSGSQSPCVVASTQTVIPQPQDLTVTTDLTTASVTWSKTLDQVSYLLSLCRDGEEEKLIYTKDLRYSLTGLQPGTKYTISVSTVVSSGYKSEAVTKSFYTDLPPPGPIQFTSVTSDSVSLCWGTPEGPTGPQRFRVNWKQEGNEQNLIVPVTTITIESLTPGEQYEFSVTTIGDKGSQSPCVVASTQTVIPQLQDLTVTADLTTASVTWSKALDQVSYLLSLCRDGEEEKLIYTKDLRCSLTGLQPGTEYKISVSTVVSSGYKSEAVTKSFYTGNSEK